MMRFTGWVLLALLLTGCQSSGSGSSQSRHELQKLPMQPIVVRTSGYGALPEGEQRTPQAMLKVRRASQLDAMRNLTERVYGTGIYGQSTVRDFVVDDDSYRAYVDGYLRGARVESVKEHDDGVVETTMMLKLEPGFQACVANILPEQARGSCGIPLPSGHDGAGPVLSRSDDSGKAAKDAPASLYYLE
ncbi:MAG: hypothetical protein R3296_11620 [Oleiphilaceae bacterium]|nr:hypothetical protein [Oleiphilaceae bacterium]